MAKQRIYYPRTTYSQRQTLFETWEATGDIKAAYEAAHTSRRTFYYWKGRFEEGGYEGLKEKRKPGPVKGMWVSTEIQEKVVEMKKSHPEWGKQRIADEAAKNNGWVPLVSVNTVRRILQEKGLWEKVTQGAEKKFQPVSRTAEEPEQSINADLCFVPFDHEVEVKLPAVSGSSGQLVVARLSEDEGEKWYPGQVFADESMSYEEAMVQFVADSDAEASGVETELSPEAAERARAKEEKAALRRVEEELKVERQQVRERRHQEDTEWQGRRLERRQQQEAREAQRAAGVKPPHGSKKATDEAWRQERQRRRQQVAQRKLVDEAWRQQRRQIRERWQRTRVITAWIAILVITDSCTRQCLGLPLFVAGAHVTAEMVVAALRLLLPPELQFLISDRGTHFTAKVFQQLAQDEEFIHVLIARHRPQSNGIAERFVRTLKEWLRNKSWPSPPELEALLFQFLHEYNNRPHQGLPIPVSPNEYANRAGLM